MIFLVIIIGKVPTLLFYMIGIIIIKSKPIKLICKLQSSGKIRIKRSGSSFSLASNNYFQKVHFIQ